MDPQELFSPALPPSVDAVRQAVGGGCQSGWGAVAVGYKYHGSWNLPSGRQWLGIGCVPWRREGGGVTPPLSMHPWSLFRRSSSSVVFLCTFALNATGCVTPEVPASTKFAPSLCPPVPPSRDRFCLPGFIALNECVVARVGMCVEGLLFLSPALLLSVDALNFCTLLGQNGPTGLLRQGAAHTVHAVHAAWRALRRQPSGHEQYSNTKRCWKVGTGHRMQEWVMPTFVYG